MSGGSFDKGFEWVGFRLQETRSARRMEPDRRVRCYGHASDH